MIDRADNDLAAHREGSGENCRDDEYRSDESHLAIISSPPNDKTSARHRQSGFEISLAAEDKARNYPTLLLIFTLQPIFAIAPSR
jgi:hypothetical protein